MGGKRGGGIDFLLSEAYKVPGVYVFGRLRGHSGCGIGVAAEYHHGASGVAWSVRAPVAAFMLSAAYSVDHSYSIMPDAVTIFLGITRTLHKNAII